MQILSVMDLVAIVCFVAAWGGYALVIEKTAHGRNGLNARMNVYREVWVRRVLEREVRISDVQIMASLQNGTAFFASTSLLAVGGALTLLRSPEEILMVVAALPLGVSGGRALWELKIIGLVVILIYAFFKFAWSYRLFNYVNILYGAMPPAAEKDTPEAAAHVRRTARLFESAGQHFNRGQRAFFFALGYLGWFAGPIALIIATVAVVLVMWRRQFRSNSQQAMAS
ncbi:MAG TPA: DUF599 domain-containing protein [Xanthobacteraceae bacterium]|nr:DUF599 domain-containing protein [Xanthobacteraceae bacterium]